MHLQQMTPVIFNPSMGTCSETVVGIDRSFPKGNCSPENPPSTLLASAAGALNNPYINATSYFDWGPFLDNYLLQSFTISPLTFNSRIT